MTKQELIKILDEKIENAENNLKMIMSASEDPLLFSKHTRQTSL